MFLKQSYNKSTGNTRLSLVQGYRHIGYAAPKADYSKLGLRDFFQSKQRSLNVDFNLNSIFSLLTFNRFLFPSSKKKV